MTEGPVQKNNGVRSGELDHLWSEKMSGLITDMNITQDGSGILISLIPDPEGSEIKVPTLRYLNQKGTLLWELPLENKVKWQTLSPNGDWSVVAHYDEKILALNGAGKLLWTKDGNCRPVILQKFKRVYCFHDDDPKPHGIAFDVWDQKGSFLGSVKTQKELLDSAVSPSENRIVLGLEDGRIVLVNAESLRPEWESKVAGEVIAVAITELPRSRVAVLFNKRPSGPAGTPGPQLALLGDEGKVLTQFALKHRFEQIGMSPNGKLIALYGNNPYGQSLVLWTLQEGPGQSITYKELWKKDSPQYSDYTSPFAVGEHQVTAGFQKSTAVEPGQSFGYLIAYEPETQTEWSIPLMGEEGGYLYARTLRRPDALVYVASDTGLLSAYQLVK